MSDTILLIFEGEKTEPSIFDNIKKVFFEDCDSKRMVYAIFGTNILKLWKELNNDPDFETVEMLRDVARNKDNLKDITRNNVSEIHLFFDFEGHLPEKALDDYCAIIYKMLAFFDEETEHGKLWISYPMVEALKHIYKDLTKCFDCIQNIGDNTRYKEKVGKVNDFQDTRYYTCLDWCHIIAANTRKAVCLVNRGYSMPSYIDVSPVLNQSRIFEAQKKRFISLNSSVVILSSFPFFLLYYFGERLYNKIHFDKGCKFKHIVEGGTAPKKGNMQIHALT
jgi:hypothetical protein